MNYPQRHINELKPLPNFSVPVHPLYFKAATEKFPDIWSNAIHVRQMLEREGHQEHYIMTVTADMTACLMPYTCVPMVFWTIHSLCLQKKQPTESIHWMLYSKGLYVFWSSVCTRDADIMMQ